MLIGDARELLNTMRVISEKLQTDVALSEEEMDRLRRIGFYVEAARIDCEETLEAVDAIDHAGIDKLFEAKELDRAALKQEVDKIVDVLFPYE
jgi:hypothetical protein